MASEHTKSSCAFNPGEIASALSEGTASGWIPAQEDLALSGSVHLRASMQTKSPPPTLRGFHALSYYNHLRQEGPLNVSHIQVKNCLVYK